MPCKGCGTSTPGKTRCVVCETKWCDTCKYDNAQSRSSGWKCNGCVGTPSRKQQTVTPSAEEQFIERHLKYHTQAERERILREEGFW